MAPLRPPAPVRHRSCYLHSVPGKLNHNPGWQNWQKAEPQVKDRLGVQSHLLFNLRGTEEKEEESADVQTVKLETEESSRSKLKRKLWERLKMRKLHEARDPVRRLGGTR